jgi:sulfate transport system permease protein
MQRERTIGEPLAARVALILAAVVVGGVMLLMPLLVVFTEALSKGWPKLIEALTEPDAMSAIRLTLLVTAIVVPLNTAFGLAAAWSVAHFRFPGRQVLITLIELPFSVSPVIAGMVYVLMFGLQGWLGGWLAEHNIKLIFALPGIVLATAFVTLPFVARQVAPLMQAQGVDEEEAALTLGASGWQVFTRVTLLKVRWALLYGILLCNARSMGEFGAVSVVSGHIRGFTNTMPLHVEILYNEYNLAAAFGMASLLALMAIATIGVRMALEWHHRRSLSQGAAAVWVEST